MKNNLRQIREECGFSTRKEFAQYLGMGVTTYCCWEKHAYEPPYRRLSMIGRILGRPVADLIETNEDERKSGA